MLMRGSVPKRQPVERPERQERPVLLADVPVSLNFRQVNVAPDNAFVHAYRFPATGLVRKLAVFVEGMDPADQPLYMEIQMGDETLGPFRIVDGKFTADGMFPVQEHTQAVVTLFVSTLLKPGEQPEVRPVFIDSLDFTFLYRVAHGA